MYSSKMCISNLDLTRVLLNFGSSSGIGEKDMEEGNTPLHWAIVGGVMSPYTLAPLLKVGDTHGGQRVFLKAGPKYSACGHCSSYVLLEHCVACGAVCQKLGSMGMHLIKSLKLLSTGSFPIIGCVSQNANLAAQDFDCGCDMLTKSLCFVPLV